MLLSDLRYAVRSLSRTRGFALAVILTLGLGIGANTAIFSVVRGVLLKPLPHREGERLVYLRQSVDGPGGENIRFSVPEINDFREGAKSLAGVAEYSGIAYTMQDDREASRINVGLVTGNYFKVMGLGTVLGRSLDERDDGTKVPPVMVLTHDFWQRRFGGDPAIVGKRLRVDGKAVEVVGVMQAAPTFPERMDALLNMVISEHHTSAMMVQGRSHRMTDIVARLAPGATLDRVRTEIAGVRTRVQHDYPADYDPASNPRVTVTPLREVLGEKARLTLWLLMGAAAFVMIISCANVANLTLMRGVRREHELVVRAALGSGAARLRRLLLIENLVLSLGGAVLGLVIAAGGVRLLTSLAERYSPRANEIRLDGAVLGFAVLLSVAVAFLLAYAPPLAREGQLGGLLAGGANRGSGTVRRQRLQRGLVVAQIAVSVLLLTGAGLLTRSMLALSSVEDGLKPQQVLTMEVPISYTSGDVNARNLYERMRQAVAGVPGVREVGVGSNMPLRSSQFQLEIKAEGRALRAGEPVPRAEYRTASPEYFRASGIPLLSGREFTTTDRAGAGPVVILNKSLAERLFPGTDPIGRRVAWTGEVLKFIGIGEDSWLTVVGVVGDTKDGGLDAEPKPAVFLPLAQGMAAAGGGLVIRADRDAKALIPAATKLVREVAPTEAIEHVMTVDDIRAESIAPRKLNAELVSSFGILAVVIAAVGIAGVLAFSVSARANEIGIRMSLGADASRVQRMVLGEGGVLLAIGLAIGVVASVLATRLMSGLLFGVSPHDPMTLVGVALAMVVVGLAACWLPALRASRIDPAVTIRGH